MNVRLLACLVFSILIASPAFADEIGEVDTAFKLFGANHKIVIEAFDDPKVEGVTCFLSMARKGGLSGSLGLAEDPSDASIACRQVYLQQVLWERTFGGTIAWPKIAPFLSIPIIQ